ncbi:MAG: Do family serine endopeptidase [Pelistega sp.]|nr:Do family serine endopeptidase [Pelistega sp.]
MFTKKLTQIALGVSIALGSTALSTAAFAQTPTPSPLPLPVEQALAPLVFGLPDFTSIVKETENGVVNIRTMAPERRRGSGGFDFGGDDPDEFFRFFFGPDFAPPSPRRNTPRQDRPQRDVPSGIGSGFVISADGYIITNQHVVDGSSKILVTLTNGKEYTATLVGSDKRTDLALLKIEAKDLQPLNMGNSDGLKKGQWVLAIGSPYDLESTVTAGIVSAINRDTGDYLPFVQTDVAINPGNSGGPLIDLQGRVVGVNTQIYTRSGGYMGISFSIPINEALKVVEQLKETGTVQRGRIGVMIGEVQKEVADALGLSDTSGALVSNVEQNSPAEKAGIASGDVITSFNGEKIKKWSDLPRLVGQTKPGVSADIEVWRRGKVESLKITPEAMPSEPGEVQTQPSAEPTVTAEDRLGLTVSALPVAKQTELRIKGGVLVTQVGGVAEQAGLQKDDVILTINNQEIHSVAQYLELVKNLPKDKAAALLVRRANLSQWVTVTPTK